MNYFFLVFVFLENYLLKRLNFVNQIQSISGLGCNKYSQTPLKQNPSIADSTLYLTWSVVPNIFFVKNHIKPESPLKGFVWSFGGFGSEGFPGLFDSYMVCITLQIRSMMKHLGMSLVGWYHSHPYCLPEPSVRDIECQMAYQLKMKGARSTYFPCVGIINCK